jgi:hypothetical protein
MSDGSELTMVSSRFSATGTVPAAGWRTGGVERVDGEARLDDAVIAQPVVASSAF